MLVDAAGVGEIERVEAVLLLVPMLALMLVEFTARDTRAARRADSETEEGV